MTAAHNHEDDSALWFGCPGCIDGAKLAADLSAVRASELPYRQPVNPDHIVSVMLARIDLVAKSLAPVHCDALFSASVRPAFNWLYGECVEFWCTWTDDAPIDDTSGAESAIFLACFRWLRDFRRQARKASVEVPAP